MKFKALKDLKVSKEIKKKLGEMNFNKYFEITKPRRFHKLVFFTFVDYFYLYANLKFEEILRLLAQKHQEITDCIEYIIKFMKTLNQETVSSSKSKIYRSKCSDASKILLQKTGIEVKKTENCLFTVYTKFLLLLPLAFTVFEVFKSRVTTRTIGNKLNGVVYFLKNENNYYALYLSEYPKDHIVLNLGANPRIILSCGEPATNVNTKRNQCCCSNKHILYTQEKSLIKMKTPFEYNKLLCAICKKEKPNMLTCEICKNNNCTNCTNNSKNYLCGMCGFSNFSRKLTNENFPPLGNQLIPSYYNPIQEVNPNYLHIQNDPNLPENMNIFQGNLPVINSNNQYPPLAQNYPIEYPQVPTFEKISNICEKCNNYSKCGNCSNLIYESTTGFCDSCLQKTCRFCNREVINIPYCRICENCPKCQNPLQAFFGCMNCGGKKVLIKNGKLSMMPEENDSQADPRQKTRCLKCDKAINISHRESVCCKCSEREFKSACQECRKIHYEHYYGKPNASVNNKIEDLPGRFKDFEHRNSLQDRALSYSKNESFCQECNNKVKGILGICLCGKILFATLDVVEKKLDLLMKNDKVSKLKK